MDRERKHRILVVTGARGRLLGLLIIYGWGCTTVQQGGSQTTALMAATGSKVSAAELRAMNNILAISVPGIIETTADEIEAQSPDAATKRRALLWKIEVIPAFYAALFYSDPLAAALDAWSLSIQLGEAVEFGPWRERLGSLQPIASEATHKIRMQVEAAAKATAKTDEGFDRAKAMVERWAREHPIVGPVSSRPSILPALTRMAGEGLDVSVFQVVADIPATVADLATRMDIYAAYLPKSARWQAELMSGDLADRSEFRRALVTLASVEKLTERTNALLSPEALRDGFDTASSKIRSERISALAAVDEQRVETLAYLTRERVAVVADIDREREALARHIEEVRTKVRSDVDEVSNRIIRKGAMVAALLLILAAGLTLLVVDLAYRIRARHSAKP